MVAADPAPMRSHVPPRPRARVRRLLFVGLACLIGLPAWGQADPCAGAVTQADLNECSHAAYLAADEDLNLAYEAALDAARQIDAWSEARAQDRLRVAQRAWVAYRDAACDAETAQEEGGSIHPLLYASCLERLTILRSDDLWAYAEN
jgi:uncharacterized protein YecT (DUF1311 family)